MRKCVETVYAGIPICLVSWCEYDCFPGGGLVRL